MKIDEAIDYVREVYYDFVGTKTHAEALKTLIDFCEQYQKIGEGIKKIRNIIKARLDYCKEWNGLPHCKNCGLNENDLKEIDKILEEEV